MKAAILFPALSPPRLSTGEIHVWLVSGEALRSWDWGGLLDQDERTRLLSLRLEEDRLLFSAGHGLVRLLAASYSGEAAEGIALSSLSGGKPRLNLKGMDLQFNLSHSGGRLLLAFALGRPVGVDVEACRPIENLDTLAASCLSQADYRMFLAFPDRQAGFFRLWTRQEARLKAAGLGLGARESGSDHTSAVLAGHQVLDLPAGKGWAAAVAFSAGPVRILFDRSLSFGHQP
jgi:4'-phosphopantetheinyl transferase